MNTQTTYGAVFKLMFEGEYEVFLSERRTNGKWSSAATITDDEKVYNELRNDQISLVTIDKANGMLLLKDLCLVDMLRDGDTTTIGTIIQEGKMEAVLEGCMQDYLEQTGDEKQNEH